MKVVIVITTATTKGNALTKNLEIGCHSVGYTLPLSTAHTKYNTKKQSMKLAANMRVGKI